GPARGPYVLVAKTSAQYFPQWRARFSAALARRAHKNARERSAMLKGLLRIRRYQQETPCALQEAEIRSWLRFGEAYSALRDWRPIPAALLSHSVVQCSGKEEFLPTNDRYPPAVAPVR